jgi:adenosine deaminase
MPEPPFHAPDHVPSAIHAMPKCNLHTHLEGSVRPATLIELARDQGLPLPIPASEVPAAMQVSGAEQSLADYLAKIAFAYPYLKNAAALRRVCREAAEDAAACGVRYFELRSGPATHATPELPVRDVIAAMLAGLADAEAQAGITCRLIVAALRHHAPETNVDLARAALDFRGASAARACVVGFDLAGDEARFPAALHAEAFRIARDGGLGITVHAGEAGGPGEIDYAVQALGATRIGHGVHAIESRQTLELLLAQRVTLEICPTSNVHTVAVPSIAAHPIAEFWRRGIRVTIGDDDPVTSRTNLDRELTLLHQVLDFTFADLQAMQMAGLQCSFLDDAARLNGLLAEFAGYRSTLPISFKEEI